MRHAPRAIVGVLLWVMLCGAAPVPEKTRSVKVALSEGRDAFLAKDFETAVRWLQRAYQLKPSDPDIPFNIGRSFEELGRYREAVRSFQQMVDHRRAKKADKASARSKLDALRPLLQRAHVRLGEALRGGVVLIDGKQVAAGVTDVQATPGDHELCAVDAASAVLQCWRRELPAGQRVTWPPADSGGLRATVVWEPSEAVARLEMGGTTLPVNPARLERIELDPGTHEALIVWASGDSTTVTWELGPAMRLTGQPARPATAPPKETVDATPVGEGLTVTASTTDDDGGPGVGPWITAGVGGAVLIAGVGVMGAAEANRNSILNDRDSGAISQPAASSQWADANTMTWIGTGLLVAGGAVAAGGILWFALGGGDDDGPSDDTEAARIEFAPLLTGGALVRGTF